MSSGPSKTAEAIVAVLVPPACREEVLGDLHERYSSEGQYGFDALYTIPLVIISRIRRTADPQVVLIQAFALYVSFLGAAWFNDRSFLNAHWSILRLAIPAAVALLVLVLDDVYARRGLRSTLAVGRGPILGIAIALASQALFRVSNPDVAVPGWIALYGSAMGLLLSSAIRLLFPPRSYQLAAANVPADYPRREERMRSMNSRIKIVIICAVLICAAGAFWMANTRQRSLAMLSYSQFLERVRDGQIAGVVVMGSNSGAVEAICRLKDGSAVRTILPSDYRDALTAMQDKLVNVEIRDSSSGALPLLAKATPFLMLLAIWIFLMATGRRTFSGGRLQ